MSYQASPKNIPPDRGNPAITILRIFLWLMPALFIPLGLLLSDFISNFLPTPASLSITLLIAVAATAGIGFFEDLLNFQQKRMPPPYGKGRQIRGMIFFVLNQIIVAPFVCIALLYAWAMSL